VIKNFVCRDQRKPKAFGALAQPRFLDNFVFTPVARDETMQSIAKRFAQVADDLIHTHFTSS
jgi:hypothetical protein